MTEYSLADSKFPNRTTEIYLVRHGQSIHNEKQIIAGQLDSELTGQGIEDARFVAGTLRRSDFDLIYCSDLRRARETTQVILDTLRIDCPLKLSPLLRELNYGRYTNRPVAEAFAALNYKAVQHQRYPGGESFQDLEKRVMQFASAFRAEMDGKRTLVVAHAGSIRMLLIVLDREHSQQYLMQTFSNRYLGRIVQKPGGSVSYELIQNGAVESV